jgi:hypothetical protein
LVVISAKGVFVLKGDTKLNKKYSFAQNNYKEILKGRLMADGNLL